MKTYCITYRYTLYQADTAYAFNTMIVDASELAQTIEETLHDNLIISIVLLP